MPDEKKAPSEADAATEKIDLNTKGSDEKDPGEKGSDKKDTDTKDPDEQQVGESADPPTEKMATLPGETPAAGETPADTDATSAAEPTDEPTAEPTSEPAAKPTAAPRRIPPRDPSDGSTKAVAAEKKMPAAGPKPVGPRKIEPKPSAPTQSGPRQVGPQRIGPSPTEPGKPSHKKWWAALVAAVVVIAAVAAGAYALTQRTSVDDSPEARIRSTVETFTRALAGGDLATLRSTSCGDLATFYRDIPDAEFADVHRVSLEQGNIPTVDSIDAIQVGDDDTAIAQVIAHTDANPNDRSPRTFDLRLDGDQWKVCN